MILHLNANTCDLNDTINTQTLHRRFSQAVEELDDIIDDVTAKHTAAVDPIRL